MTAYLRFLFRCLRLTFIGDWRYHAWMLLLTVISLFGLNAYCRQLVDGLATTGMTDQVSWGMYIANFTYLVGVAAAAAMLVIPVYIYRRHELHHLVIFGELLAVAAIVMCQMFIVVDMGRPDRLHHMLLRPQFPSSMLTWDALVLTIYLLLNLHICGYLIYCAYRRRKPTRLFYIPFVFVAIVWAISIHTVTAFLYVGLGSRPLWNQAILAPRFIASAFASGPAIIVLTLQIIRVFTNYDVPRQALMTLRSIIVVALSINMFLLISELFTDFYTDSQHVASIRYLYFGLHGHDSLVPWIRAAVVMNAVALTILYLPISRSLRYLNIACVLTMVGVWIEKGMGLIVPGFIPSPLGEIVEYSPTLNETLICLGIWAFGLLLYTIFVRVTVPVLSGQLTHDEPNATTMPDGASDSTAFREGDPR